MGNAEERPITVKQNTALEGYKGENKKFSPFLLLCFLKMIKLLSQNDKINIRIWQRLELW